MILGSDNENRRTVQQAAEIIARSLEADGSSAGYFGRGCPASLVKRCETGPHMKPRKRLFHHRRLSGAQVARDRWVRYPVGDGGLRRLQELLATRARVRMPCMLIYGVAARARRCCLKSFSVIMPRHVRNAAVAGPSLPLNCLPCLLRSLYAEIIRSLNSGVLPTMRLHELGTRAIGMLQHASPRMLLIDEIQHLLSCGLRDQRAALNAIKFLANKLRISIVAAGTHEALHVMRADPQIASRFEQLELPDWTESQELRRFIAGYLALLPINPSPTAIDKKFVEYLLKLSEGVTGRIIEVLRRRFTRDRRQNSEGRSRSGGGRENVVFGQRA